MLVNQAREQARKLNEPSPSTLKLGSSARKQAREQARAYSFKTEPSRACLILDSTRLGYTPRSEAFVLWGPVIRRRLKAQQRQRVAFIHYDVVSMSRNYSEAFGRKKASSDF